jgi:hypothetical protein
VVRLRKTRNTCRLTVGKPLGRYPLWKLKKKGTTLRKSNCVNARGLQLAQYIIVVEFDINSVSVLDSGTKVLALYCHEH